MSGRLTATDALLACAAATSRTEMLAARTALIRTGGTVLNDLDKASLLAGDGSAGAHLLAAVPNPTCNSTAVRSSRLQTRLFAELATASRGDGAA